MEFRNANSNAKNRGTPLFGRGGVRKTGEKGHSRGTLEWEMQVHTRFSAGWPGNSFRGPNILQTDAQEPEKKPRATRWLEVEAENAQSFARNQAGPVPPHQGFARPEDFL